MTYAKKILTTIGLLTILSLSLTRVAVAKTIKSTEAKSQIIAISTNTITVVTHAPHQERQTQKYVVTKTTIILLDGAKATLDELKVKMPCTIVEGGSTIDGKELGKIDAQTR